MDVLWCTKCGCLAYTNKHADLEYRLPGNPDSSRVEPAGCQAYYNWEASPCLPNAQVTLDGQEVQCVRCYPDDHGWADVLESNENGPLIDRHGNRVVRRRYGRVCVNFTQPRPND